MVSFSYSYFFPPLRVKRTANETMKEPPRATAPTFKLFGNTIQLTSPARSPAGDATTGGTITLTSIQETSTEEDVFGSDQDTGPSSSISMNNDRNDPESGSGKSQQAKTIEPGKEEEARRDGRPGINRSWLPCPRCESSNTKFCYYNNYDMNQPRHFCRKCQRYWTNGGHQRNLPVGSGRRKRKSKRDDDVQRDQILTGLYESSASSSSPFVMSSSVIRGARELDVQGLHGLRVWPNGAWNPP